MPFNMMHPYQGLVFSKSDCLCLRYTHEQSSNESWSIGNCYRINRIQSLTRLIQRLSDHIVDLFDMFSRCDLRYDSAVQLM